MGKFQDLTGQQFGTLVVQKYIRSNHNVPGKWLCKCSKCGKQVMIKTSGLHKNTMLGRDGCKHQTDPRPGDTFGYLTVIAQADDYIKPKTGHHEKYWKCRCICGREKDILQSNLKSGKSTTCGLCSNRISIPEKTIYYYLSQIFDDIEENYRPNFLDGKEIDIFIRSLKLGIEYDGERWHKDLSVDLTKNEQCLKNGIHLLRIREPKCPKTDQFEYQIITPKPTTNGTHMTQPIKELLLILQQSFNISCQLDVDCLRDNAIICKTVLSTAGFNSLSTQYPDIAQEWDYKQNAPLTPDKVPAHSGRKAWWICPKGHSYSSVIASRSGKEKCGCPICSNKGSAIYSNGKYIGEHSLASERPDIAAEFMEQKNGISAANISVSSNKKMWFKCAKCGYEWQSKINNRTSSNEQGCPICAKQKQIDTRRKNDISDRGSLFDARPDLCKEWDFNKNIVKPWELTTGSGYKAWWTCPKGHSYQASINHRTNNKPTGCPFCQGRYQKVQNVETGEIFNSLIDAARSCGIKCGNKIAIACQCPQKTSGGYHWKYVNE